jgi:hypothetical protein
VSQLRFKTSTPPPHPSTSQEHCHYAKPFILQHNYFSFRYPMCLAKWEMSYLIPSWASLTQYESSQPISHCHVVISHAPTKFCNNKCVFSVHIFFKNNYHTKFQSCILSAESTLQVCMMNSFVLLIVRDYKVQNRWPSVLWCPYYVSWKSVNCFESIMEWERHMDMTRPQEYLF